MGKAPTTRSQIRVLELARGGMGTVEVVLRTERGFRRLQAVKRLLPEHRSDPSFREMFLDEARLAGLIRHPNVVSVLDVGEDADGPFLVMDFIEGLSLSEAIKTMSKRHGAIPLQVCLAITASVARGLHAAHELRGHDGSELQLVHRDVSPQNVLLSYEGEVRVADFGIAKAIGRTSKTSTGLLKGKAGYMSPEQLSFRDPDRRSDLFSLGVVLYEMLAAKRLYPGGLESARRILDEPPPDLAETRPDIPDALVELAFDLLAKSPDDRPSTAEEVAERIDEISNELLLTEDPSSIRDFMNEAFGDRRDRERATMREAIERAEQPAPPRRKGVLIGAISLALIAAIASVTFWSISSEPEDETLSETQDRTEPADTPPAVEPAAPVMFATAPDEIAPTMQHAPMSTPMRRAPRREQRTETTETTTETETEQTNAPMKGMPRWDWE